MSLVLQELLNLLPNMQKGEPTWAEMKQFGCGWWLKNVTLLRRCVEMVGTAYKQKMLINWQAIMLSNLSSVYQLLECLQ